MPDGEKFSVSRTKSPTTVTPRLPLIIQGSEAFRFVCLSHIASRASRASNRMPRAPRFSQDFSARASRSHDRSSRCIFKAQPELPPALIFYAGCASDETAVYRQARLYSRNPKIITTRLHIVNHSTTHRRKKKVLGFSDRSQVLDFSELFLPSAKAPVIQAHRERTGPVGRILWAWRTRTNR